MFAGFCVAAGVALASQVTFPSTFPFQPNSPIRAAEVNSTFTAVKTAVDDNHARLTTTEASVATLQAAVTNLQTSLAAADAARTALQARVTALEQAPTVVDVSSDTVETGSFSADHVYTALNANLTPGTWLVHGFASLSTLGSEDAQQITLYNQTLGSDVPNSKSAVDTTRVGNVLAAYETTKVMDVTVPTVVRLKGLRNGASTLRFGDPISSTPIGTLVGKQRIVAVKLR